VKTDRAVISCTESSRRGYRTTRAFSSNARREWRSLVQ
jgi:hypothetical protein